MDDIVFFPINRYEKSYMHRDVVTHVAVSAAEFFITGSDDGNTKMLRLYFQVSSYTSATCILHFT